MLAHAFDFAALFIVAYCMHPVVVLQLNVQNFPTQFCQTVHRVRYLNKIFDMGNYY